MKQLSMLSALLLCSIVAFSQDAPADHKDKVPLGGFQKPALSLLPKEEAIFTAPEPQPEEPRQVFSMPVLTPAKNVHHHLLVAAPDPSVRQHLRVKKP